MVTKSLSVVLDDNDEVMCLYRHMDGYLSAMGQDLADFAKDFTIVNGLGNNINKVANGMGCFAAQLVKHLKGGPGGIYLYPSGTRNCGEEYLYTLYEKNNTIWMRIQVGPMTAFGDSSGIELEEQKSLWDSPAKDFILKDIELLENKYWNRAICI